MTERALIYLHIPKSSGIAVSHALIMAELPKRIFFGFDRAFFGPFDDFATVAPENRALIHLSAATIPKDEPFVRAHMALSTLRTAFPTGRFFTVLREPFCRLMSHYLFWRGFSEAQTAGWGGWAAFSNRARAPLEQFLADEAVACQTDNVATRLLLWPHPLIPDIGMIDPQHDAVLFEQARRRMDAFDFADAIENPYFDANLTRFLGKPPERVRLNETDPMPPAMCTRLDHALTPRAQALLAARCRLDLLLWQDILRRRAPDVDVAALRASVVQKGTARAALLLAGCGK
jgi:hypothetical protein